MAIVQYKYHRGDKVEIYKYEVRYSSIIFEVLISIFLAQ